MQPLEPRRETRLFSHKKSSSSSLNSLNSLNSFDSTSSTSSTSTIPSGPIFHKSALTGAEPIPQLEQSFFRDVLISLLLFLLISEWLHPLAWMADASVETGPILVVFAICIAIDCLKVPYVWGWSAKAALILLFIGFMFNRESFMTGVWVIDVARVFIEDTNHLMQGRFEMISGELRTLFFLMGWSLLISVIQALMLQRQHSLWFVGATLAYLVVLQLVLGADTSHGIMRTLGYGLLLLALLNLARIEQTYGFASVPPGRAFKWMAATVALVGLLAGAAWYSAKQTDPQPLMKPVSWAYLSDRLFELYNEELPTGEGAGAGAAKSGYSQNDTVLGGPLQVDTTPVFTAKTSELTYWRGESKNFYDGKGWSQTKQSLTSYVQPAVQNASDRSVTQEILWNDQTPNKQLFTGGNLLSVDTLLTDKGKPLSAGTLLASPYTGKVTLPDISDPLSYYKISVQPVKEDPALLNADMGGYPDEIARDYLQLPDALPRSVRSVAEQVTANRTTPYAKAVAVEQYLSHTYTYSLEKPTRPSRSEDFVSHFLFVDKAGYCDHFSTAMVVMLRSVGVPARWVKGYAPGTLQASDGIEPMQEVLVRNQDAHSWVEVYFPSMGWVPFEPTPGFSGISSDHPRETLTTAAMEQSAMTASLMNMPLPGGLTGNTAEWLHATKDSTLAYVKANRDLLFIGIGCVVIAAGLLLYLKRKGFTANAALAPYYHKRNDPSHPLIPYMDRLWLQLFRKHGAKPKNQTVRDYVTGLHLKQPAQKQALLQFALMYESIRYDTAGSALYTKREIAEIWKAIQKTH